MIENPKRPDCNSCYHFSKSDFNETEGYCRICKKHLNSKEGEECEQFEPCSLYCDTDSVTTNTPCLNALFDTRAIKPEIYAELREQDFDTWLDTILHEIVVQVNFDASEVDALGGAVWNGECPDGTPYPKQCAREDAYIQCIRQSNQLDAHSAKLELLDDKIDALKDLFDDLEAQINDLSIRFDEFKKFVGYTLADPAVSHHTGSNFCGNCSHYQAPTSSVTLPTCKISGEIIDPDDSSCAMFEPPF